MHGHMHVLQLASEFLLLTKSTIYNISFWKLSPWKTLGRRTLSGNTLAEAYVGIELSLFQSSC